MRRHMLADRTKKHPRKATVAAGPDHDEVCVGGGVKEPSSRVTFDHILFDDQPVIITKRGGNCVVLQPAGELLQTRGLGPSSDVSHPDGRDGR